MMQQIESWINNYNTNETRKSAMTSLNSLQNYLKNNNIKEQDFIDSMKLTNDAKYLKLNDYQNSLNIMPASAKKYHAFIKSYLRVIHGIKLDIEDQKQFIKFKQIARVNREPLTREIIKNICQNSNDYYLALWLVLSSSGMRISEALSLTKEDYDFSSKPIMITIPAIETKTQSERITFISKEAYKAIQKTDYFTPRTLNTVESYFWKLRNKLSLTERYAGTRNYKVNIHSLRAYARTQAGKINQDFAEALLGHEGYLKQYVRLEKKDMINNYSKLEPKLKIF
jgi:integrase